VDVFVSGWVGVGVFVGVVWGGGGSGGGQARILAGDKRFRAFEGTNTRLTKSHIPIDVLNLFLCVTLHLYLGQTCCRFSLDFLEY
jgi:hypothetical protein